MIITAENKKKNKKVTDYECLMHSNFKVKKQNNKV